MITASFLPQPPTAPRAAGIITVPGAREATPHHTFDWTLRSSALQSRRQHILNLGPLRLVQNLVGCCPFLDLVFTLLHPPSGSETLQGGNTKESELHQHLGVPKVVAITQLQSPYPLSLFCSPFRKLFFFGLTPFATLNVELYLLYSSGWDETASSSSSACACMIGVGQSVRCAVKTHVWWGYSAQDRSRGRTAKHLGNIPGFYSWRPVTLWVRQRHLHATFLKGTQLWGFWIDRFVPRITHPHRTPIESSPDRLRTGANLASRGEHLVLQA